MQKLTIGALALLMDAASAFTTTNPTHQNYDSFVTKRNLVVKSNTNNYDYALIFDCDGVIIETEELHRLAYNAAFQQAGVEVNGEPVVWSTEYYDVLQNTVGGGKPKMMYHFKETLGAFPEEITTEDELKVLVDSLQANKTELYKALVAEKATPRPGVIELMDEAIAAPDIAVGVCSASTKAAVTRVLDTVLGEERRMKLDVTLLGDDVAKLKPDPLIYSTAAERLDIDPARCVVVEDSVVGLKAAKGAGMKCLITYTSSTEAEDFYGLGADAKVPELGARGVTLNSIFGPIKAYGVDAEICTESRDAGKQGGEVNLPSLSVTVDESPALTTLFKPFMRYSPYGPNEDESHNWFNEVVTFDVKSPSTATVDKSQAVTTLFEPFMRYLPYGPNEDDSLNWFNEVVTFEVNSSSSGEAQAQDSGRLPLMFEKYLSPFHADEGDYLNWYNEVVTFSESD